MEMNFVVCTVYAPFSTGVKTFKDRAEAEAFHTKESKSYESTLTEVKRGIRPNTKAVTNPLVDSLAPLPVSEPFVMLTPEEMMEDQLA